MKTTARIVTPKFLTTGIALLFLTAMSSSAQTNSLGPALVAQSGSQSSFVLDVRGFLLDWEDNQHGQLGIGVQSTNLHAAEPNPVSVPLPAGVARWAGVAGGTFHTLAIGDNGKIYACGENNYGQLGVPGSQDRLSFILVPSPIEITNWLAVAAGDHSLALADDGKLFAWGANYDGQLGNGNQNNQSTLQLVPFPTGITRWVRIAAGDAHSLAIGDNGVLYAWGANYYGQLGNGSNLKQVQPVAVVFPPEVSSWQAVAAGFEFTLALGNNGLIYGWGWNSEGQLGNGTFTNSNVPLPALFPDGVAGWIRIVAGASEGFALGANGDLYSWGIGVRGPQPLPLRVPFPTEGQGWADVAGGRGHALGLGSDCRLYQWGWRFSQTTPQTTPAVVQGLETLCTAPSNAPPVIAFSSPTNSAIILAPATICLQAEAADPDGTISLVQFFDGNHLLGDGLLSGPIYSMNWSNASIGRHVLSARAVDNLGLTAISAPVTITFANSNLNTVSLIVLDGAASEVGPHNGICLLTRSGSTDAPLRVNFSLGGTAINGVDYLGINYTYLSNLVVLPAGVASSQFGIRPLADNLLEGDETVIFTLVDSPSYNVAPENQVIITITDNQTGISNQNPFITLIAPTDGRLYLAPARVQLSAIINAPAAPGATVEFFQGTNSLGTSGNVSLNPATNLFRLFWSDVPPGSYTLSSKTMDTNGASVASLPVHINVLDRANLPSVGIDLPTGTNQLTQVLVSGQPDGIYTIEYSTNAVTWRALTTASSSNGVVRFTDFQAATGASHFYRAVIVP